MKIAKCLNCWNFVILCQKVPFCRAESDSILIQNNFTFKCLHDRTNFLSHFGGICRNRNIFQFEALINFFKRFKDFFTAGENLHPDHPCQFIVVTFQNVKIFKNPILYLLLLNKVIHNFNAIFKVIVDFFSCESNSVWESWIAISVMTGLRIEIWHKLILVF